MTTYIGIDYSYTSPSVCILGEDFRSSQFYFMNSVKKVCIKYNNYEGTRLVKEDFLHDVQRYDFVSNWAMSKIKQHYKPGETKIFMEGFAFGSTTGLVFNIAENGGTLKFKLHKELGEYPTLIAPTSAKKFFTGSGKCGKDGMVMALWKNEGVNVMKDLGLDGKVRSPVHDIVDSYAIAKMGRDTFKA